MMFVFEHHELLIISIIKERNSKYQLNMKWNTILERNAETLYETQHWTEIGYIRQASTV